jgi:hypothetical protein
LSCESSQKDKALSSDDDTASEDRHTGRALPFHFPPDRQSGQTGTKEKNGPWLGMFEPGGGKSARLNATSASNSGSASFATNEIELERMPK